MSSIQVKAARARSRAVDELIRRHKTEFDAIYGDSRVQYGLPREFGYAKQSIDHKIAVLEAKIAALRAQTGVA